MDLEPQAVIPPIFRSLLDQADIGILFLDVGLRCRFINQAASEFLGRPIHDLIGRSIEEILPDIADAGMAGNFLRSFNKTLATGRGFRHKGWTRTGDHELYADWALSRVGDEDGNPLGLLVTLNLLEETEYGVRKELEESEERFRSIFEQAAVGIAYVDLNGRYVRVNKKFSEICGYSEEELQTKNVRDITHPEDFPTDLELTRHLLEGEIDNFSLEKRFVCKNGSVVWIRLTASAMKDSRSRLKNCIRVIEDISRRKQIEEERRIYQEKLILANQELKSLEKIRSEFTSMVSHELRTPLAAIKESINLTYEEADGPLNAAQKATLEICKNNIDRLTRLIQNTLLFSKVEAGKEAVTLVPVDIAPLMEATCALMQLTARKKNITLSCELPPKGVMIRCDPDKIQQVVINLLDNAVKYTPKGGSIQFSLFDAGDHYRFEVTDTGVGIPPEERETIFDLFEQGSTTKQMGITGGVGVGLAVCKKIVEQHSGKIGVESDPGKGSKFTVCLPK